MRTVRLIALLAPVTALLLLSCQRLPLELYYSGDADVNITYDWLSRFGEVPQSMMVFFAYNGDSISKFDSNYKVDNWESQMPAGTYLLTVMNKTIREYSTLEFPMPDRLSHDRIYAKAKTYTVSDENAWDYGRTYMMEPERIGVATDTFYVSEGVDDLSFYNYKNNETGDTLHLKRDQTILPMTTQLTISVKVRGINFMREGSLQGYITGMADGFYMNKRWRRTEVGTMKLDKWIIDTDHANTRADDSGSNSKDGWVKCVVETFGLPHGKELLNQRTPDNNYILLHFTLLDGRTKDFSYHVGRDIRYKGDDGKLEYFDETDVTLELNLVIDAPFYSDDDVPTLPYAQPEGSGQFGAEVAPWGDDVDVEIPF